MLYQVSNCSLLISLTLQILSYEQIFINVMRTIPKKQWCKMAYATPTITLNEIEMETSIAASSATVSPGGGTGNSNPWITEEIEEVRNNEWELFG